MDDSPVDESRTRSRVEGDGALALSTAFDLLARQPRRRLLVWLHQHAPNEVSLDAIGRHLSNGESGGLTEGEGWDQRVELALHHVHLPKLAEADVVTYDPDAGTIEYLGDPRLETLLSWIEAEGFVE